MNVVILGSNGQVGRALAESAPNHARVTAWSRAQADLARIEAVLDELDRLRPTVVINAAAYTAVDRAESEPDLARSINALAPGRLARWCADSGAAFVHYSTDYVFDGSGNAPRSETDPTGPLNVYGRTKLEGEERVRETGGSSLVLRTSWVFAAEGANFFRTMLRLASERAELAIVDDQWGAPTLADDLATATWRALDRALGGDGRAARPDAFGLYHVCGSGETTWKRFAERIFAEARESGAPLKIERVRSLTTAEYGAPAIRPLNSRLSCEKFRRAFDFEMPTWENALARAARRWAAGRSPTAN